MCVCVCVCVYVCACMSVYVRARVYVSKLDSPNREEQCAIILALLREAGKFISFAGCCEALGCSDYRLQADNAGLNAQYTQHQFCPQDRWRPFPR